MSRPSGMPTAIAITKPAANSLRLVVMCGHIEPLPKSVAEARQIADGVLNSDLR